MSAFQSGCSQKTWPDQCPYGCPCDMSRLSLHTIVHNTHNTHHAVQSDAEHDLCCGTTQQFLLECWNSTPFLSCRAAAKCPSQATNNWRP